MDSIFIKKSINFVIYSFWLVNWRLFSNTPHGRGACTVCGIECETVCRIETESIIRGQYKHVIIMEKDLKRTNVTFRYRWPNIDI